MKGHPIRAVKLSIGQETPLYHCRSSDKTSGSNYMVQSLLIWGQRWVLRVVYVDFSEMIDFSRFDPIKI